MRNELQAALHLAETSSLGEIPALLGELEQIRVTALARLSVPVAAGPPDELLDVAVAAKRLGVSEDYLYRHQSKFPFVRKIGRKLLFSSSGLDKYLARMRAPGNGVGTMLAAIQKFHESA
jgi:excisionase family DNA binding protein